MDVDDDDECMNAAAAHAAFVMTVSSASMYWLLRHAQHARDINIQLGPLCRFSAQLNTPFMQYYFTTYFYGPIHRVTGNFFISAVFRHFVGKVCEMFLLLTSVDVTFSIR